MAVLRFAKVSACFSTLFLAAPALHDGSECSSSGSCPTKGHALLQIDADKTKVSKVKLFGKKKTKWISATFPAKLQGTSLLASATTKRQDEFCATPVDPVNLLSDTKDEDGEEHIKGIMAELDDGTRIRLMPHHWEMKHKNARKEYTGKLCCKGKQPHGNDEELVIATCSAIPSAAQSESIDTIINVTVDAKDDDALALAASQVGQLAREVRDIGAVVLISDSRVHAKVVSELGDRGVAYHLPWPLDWIFHR